jgi:hypothetical protein
LPGFKLLNPNLTSIPRGMNDPAMISNPEGSATIVGFVRLFLSE